MRILPRHRTNHPHDPALWLDGFTSIASLLYLGILYIQFFIQPGSIALNYLIVIEVLFACLLLLEFLFFYFYSKSKVQFIRNYWIDLVAAIPFVTLMGLGSAAVLLNVFKAFRGLKALKHVWEWVSGGTCALWLKVISMFLFCVSYATMTIAYLEQDLVTTPISFGDAFFIAVSTITSVGYGDVFPLTPTGRVLSLFLMVLGVGISSCIGATFVKWVITPTQEEIKREEKVIEAKEDQILAQQEKILKELKELKKKDAKKPAKKTSKKPVKKKTPKKTKS